jgi:hypothetical protein
MRNLFILVGKPEWNDHLGDLGIDGRIILKWILNMVGLDGRGSGARFSAGAGNFSLNHRVQTCSGAHPASYPMGTRGSFPGGKDTGT